MDLRCVAQIHIKIILLACDFKELLLCNAFNWNAFEACLGEFRLWKVPLRQKFCITIFFLLSLSLSLFPSVYPALVQGPLFGTSRSTSSSLGRPRGQHWFVSCLAWSGPSTSSSVDVVHRGSGAILVRQLILLHCGWHGRTSGDVLPSSSHWLGPLLVFSVRPHSGPDPVESTKAPIGAYASPCCGGPAGVWWMQANIPLHRVRLAAQRSYRSSPWDGWVIVDCIIFLRFGATLTRRRWHAHVCLGGCHHLPREWSHGIWNISLSSGLDRLLMVPAVCRPHSIYSVFVRLSHSPFSFSRSFHCCTWSLRVWRSSFASRTSSAYRSIHRCVDWISAVAVSIHRMNRKGERADPWWTPTLTRKAGEIPTGQRTTLTVSW